MMVSNRNLLFPGLFSGAKLVSGSGISPIFLGIDSKPSFKFMGLGGVPMGIQEKNHTPSIIDRLGQVMFFFPNPIIEKSI